MAERPRALIVGIGEGLGIGLAGTFAEAGYDVLGLGRSDRVADVAEARVAAAGGRYLHLIADVTDPAQLDAALAPIADGVEVLVHNVHALLIKTFAETTPQEFEEVWRAGCLGAMLVARRIAPGMVARRRGTMLFSGATASRRGGARFAAFAAAKFALRGMVQALGRELGPKGVHVAHVVIDGLIDAPQTDRRFGAATGLRLDPTAAAQAYLTLAQQHRSAWSQELDLRPQAEAF